MRIAAMTLSLCMTGLGTAGAIDWTKDPVAELQELKAGGQAVLVSAPVPRAAVVDPDDVPEAMRHADVAAAASGIADVSRVALSPLRRPETYLALNNTKEKVGGVFESCEENRHDGIPDCDRVVLEFPQLRYDARQKRILLGDETVATLNWFGAIRMSRSFELAYLLAKSEDRSGFNMVRRQSVRLFLVRTGE